MTRVTYKPSPIGDAECHGEAGRWTLVLVRELRHPPEKVWAALTDPDQLIEWAPYAADRNLDGVGDVTLTMISRNATQELQATVTRAERPWRLEYTWGGDLLRWQLEAIESGTRLTLRHTVSDEVSVAKATAGWHICLDVAEHLLDGDPIGPIRGEDAMDHGWQELHDAYAARLGVDSTMS
jgi:uncharacterized protein YndB with AHSA1/START domain